MTNAVTPSELKDFAAYNQEEYNNGNINAITVKITSNHKLTNYVIANPYNHPYVTNKSVDPYKFYGKEFVDQWMKLAVAHIQQTGGIL